MSLARLSEQTGDTSDANYFTPSEVFSEVKAKTVKLLVKHIHSPVKFRVK